MGGCSAINCSNHSGKGNKMVRFPRDVERRKKWVINCRRSDWQPGPQAQLCIDHFEESQFESHRCDGKRKLRPDATPTLFDIPNSPPLLAAKRIKGFGYPKPGSVLEKIKHEKENVEQSPDVLWKKIEMLEKEKEALQHALKEKDAKLSTFLSNEQISTLNKDRGAIAHWTDASIIKGLKLRFALGKHGFNYLRETGYPIPAYSTLNRRIQSVKVDFGILRMLFFLLKTNIEVMDILDKNCCLLVDEMEISNYQEFDTSAKRFVDNVTLGQPGVAKHYTVVMLRGLKSPWKQVVAHELTGPSTSGLNMKKLITETVDAAREVGLKVRASTSDMGSNNRAMWRSLNVCVSRNERQASYTIGNDAEVIHSFADVPHLLKNMRSAFLSQIIILPSTVCQEHDLPSNQVSSGYVKQLWISEIKSESALRSLHHLSKVHLFPSHFSSMNVATAVQLFSIKTAAAIEKAVNLRQIQKSALTTAWWIRILAQWFTVMTARHRKVGITKRNKEAKFNFLIYFIDVIQKTQLDQGWKPLQTGMIMSTLSVMNLTTELFTEGFTYFLPGRLTQDALENVFSQVRRKSGSKPTAVQAKRAIKLICVSQFISDVKNSNYASESDYHLMNSFSLEESFPSEAQSEELSLVVTGEQQEASSLSGESSTAEASACSILPPAVEENDIFYIGGAILNAILKHKNICKYCQDSIKTAKDLVEPSVPRYRTLLTEYTNMGGLQNPESGLYRVCREAERGFRKHKDQLLTLQLPITDSLIDNVKAHCMNVILPTCCKLKEFIIKYYLITRCKGLQKCVINKRAHETCFSSASANKKKKIA